MEVVPPALEKRMFLHMKNHVEIAVGAALHPGLAESGESNAGFVLDAGGNPGVNNFLLNGPAFAAALGAGVADHASRTLAGRARARNAEETLLIAHLTATTATPAGGRRFSLRAA